MENRARRDSIEEQSYQDDQEFRRSCTAVVLAEACLDIAFRIDLLRGWFLLIRWNGSVPWPGLALGTTKGTKKDTLDYTMIKRFLSCFREIFEIAERKGLLFQYPRMLPSQYPLLQGSLLMIIQTRVGQHYVGYDVQKNTAPHPCCFHQAWNQSASCGVRIQSNASHCLYRHLYFTS